MNIDDNYQCFEQVMQNCIDQIQHGKGHERHGEDDSFQHQSTWKITQECGEGFPIGQACKKALESNRLPKDRKITELRGAVGYLLIALLYLEGN